MQLERVDGVGLARFEAVEGIVAGAGLRFVLQRFVCGLVLDLDHVEAFVRIDQRLHLGIGGRAAFDRSQDDGSDCRAVVVERRLGGLVRLEDSQGCAATNSWRYVSMREMCCPAVVPMSRLS